MKKFTEKQMEELKAQVTTIMDRLAEGMDTTQICAQMYVDDLENKTLTQGEAMAESILDSIAEFDRDYARAKADVDTFVDDFVYEACGEKPLEERCTYLTKLISAVCAADHILHPDSRNAHRHALTLVVTADEVHFQEGEATEKLERHLLDQLKNALKGSSILFSAISTQREALLEIEEEDKAASILVDVGSRDIDYRAILSMQAYINIKKGAYEDIPDDLSAAQTATMVCTCMEELNILHRLDKKEIGLELASALLGILGIVAIVRMSISAVVAGTVLCASMFGWFLAIPAVMVVVTSIIDCSAKIAALWAENCKTIVRVTSLCVKSVCWAAGAVLSFAVKHTIQAVSWMLKQAMAVVKRVINLLHRGKKAQESDPTAVVDAEELEAVIEEDLFEEEILEEELPEEEYETV